MYLIGPRPAVLQNMLAELGQGVLDHSVFFADTAARVKRSLPPIFMTVYGADDVNEGTRVRDFHTTIKGDMPDGSRYHALDPDTYFWAHTTFVDQLLYFADTFVKRLTREEKEQIYLESKTWYRRYGVSDRPMPADYDEFERYWNRMINEIVVPHQTAEYGVGYVTKGFPRPKGVPPLVWKVIAPAVNPVAAFLTTGGMPPRTRDMPALQQIRSNRLCQGLTAPQKPSSTPPSSSSNSMGSAALRSMTLPAAPESAAPPSTGDSATRTS
jgi:uncharacterized protein (DUF2236 family)